MRGKQESHWLALLSLMVGLAVVGVWAGAPTEAQAGEISLELEGSWEIFAAVDTGGQPKSGSFPPTNVSETVIRNTSSGFAQATLNVVQDSPSQITFSSATQVTCLEAGGLQHVW